MCGQRGRDLHSLANPKTRIRVRYFPLRPGHLFLFRPHPKRSFRSATISSNSSISACICRTSNRVVQSFAQCPGCLHRRHTSDGTFRARFRAASSSIGVTDEGGGGGGKIRGTTEIPGGAGGRDANGGGGWGRTVRLKSGRTRRCYRSVCVVPVMARCVTRLYSRARECSIQSSTSEIEGRDGESERVVCSDFARPRRNLMTTAPLSPSFAFLHKCPEAVDVCVHGFSGPLEVFRVLQFDHCSLCFCDRVEFVAESIHERLDGDPDNDPVAAW